MPTLDSNANRFSALHAEAAGLWIDRMFLFLTGALLLFVGGCSKDPGMEAVETDANGYFCQNCKVKLFTERKVFLENCPKCGETRSRM